MDFDYDSIKMVPFQDYIVATHGNNKNNLLDITLEGEFSTYEYCKQIFRKVRTIGLSELVDFLDYQCAQLKCPISWLNSLEKLISVNMASFNTDDLLHRHSKWVGEIISKRHELKAVAAQHARAQKTQHFLNGYTGDKVYSIDAVKEKIEVMETAEEKVLYLKAQIKDYRQNPPEYEYTLKPKFDQLCKLEIDDILDSEELLDKVKAKKAGQKKLVAADPKGQIYCNTNAFLDMFYQMMNDLSVDGDPLMKIAPADLARVISENFKDKDGNQISRATILTIIDPNRQEKRPKHHKRYKINDIDG
jgi:hypothetical protein